MSPPIPVKGRDGTRQTSSNSPCSRSPWTRFNDAASSRLMTFRSVAVPACPVCKVFTVSKSIRKTETRPDRRQSADRAAGRAGRIANQYSDRCRRRRIRHDLLLVRHRERDLQGGEEIDAESVPGADTRVRLRRPEDRLLALEPGGRERGAGAA